ncbi:MAG TPA: STAS domain-containing protein, partial [Nitrospiria bacterium]
FQPKQMTPKVLQEGFFWANREIFSLSSIARRMAHTSQRLIPRLLMNWQFRKLVRRTCPRGRLSPLNQVIKGLQGQFPSIDTGNLIPNTLWAVKSSVRAATGQIDHFLRVKVRRAEHLVGGLVIELEGTLDRFNVAKVKKRVLKAAKKAHTDIVINFEHLRYAAPEAIRALLDWDRLRKVAPSVKIKVMNLKASFKETLGNLSLAGLEVSKEEIG